MNGDLPDIGDAACVFVSPAGAPGNTGTRASPLDSPGRAAQLASRDGRCVVIAAGEYAEQVRTSVSLYGGFAPDFSANDPARFVTRIHAGGDAHSTSAVEVRDVGPDAVVTVYGLTLRGGPGTHAAALRIDGEAAVTVRSCNLHGGGRGPGPEGFTYSAGIHVGSDARVALVVVGNRIHGGVNQSSCGIEGAGSGARIEGNQIEGGDCATPNSRTYGLRGGGSVTLRGNTIDSGHGAVARSLCLRSGGATIVGNTITSRRGDPSQAIEIRSDDGGLTLSGNTIDGIPDERVFAFAGRLSNRTWRYNEIEGQVWSFDAVSLERWGWIRYWSDSSIEPTGGGYGGPSQSFGDFLRNGPARDLPPGIAAEIRTRLEDVGVG